jgi:hypothetical protein
MLLERGRRDDGACQETAKRGLDPIPNVPIPVDRNRRRLVLPVNAEMCHERGRSREEDAACSREQVGAHFGRLRLLHKQPQAAGEGGARERQKVAGEYGQGGLGRGAVRHVGCEIAPTPDRVNTDTMPDTQPHVSSGEWSVIAKPLPAGRWSLEVHRLGAYCGSAFFTADRGIYDVRVRRSGVRDTIPFPTVELSDQLRKAMAPPQAAG